MPSGKHTPAPGWNSCGSRQWNHNCPRSVGKPAHVNPHASGLFGCVRSFKSLCELWQQQQQHIVKKGLFLAYRRLCLSR